MDVTGKSGECKNGVKLPLAPKNTAKMAALHGKGRKLRTSVARIQGN